MLLRSGIAIALAFYANAAAAQSWPPGAYMETPPRLASCVDIVAADPLSHNPVVQPYFDAGQAAGWAIRRCVYSYRSSLDPDTRPDRQGWVILADPPAATLAQWIHAACEAGAPGLTTCESGLRSYVAGSNGGQFPVLGFVAEGGDGLCVQNNHPVEKTGLIAFQDGVTVQHYANPADETNALYCVTEPADIDLQRDWATTRRISAVYSVSRLAGLRQSCGASLLTPELRARATALGLKSPWLLASRENFINAMATGRDQMLVIQARRLAAGLPATMLHRDC